MQAHVADQLVVHGARVARTGVITEIVDGSGPQRYRVRWDDGHESTISPGADAAVIPAPTPSWEQVRAAREAGAGRRWRPTIVAGVGHEASVAVDALEPETGEAG